MSFFPLCPVTVLYHYHKGNVPTIEELPLIHCNGGIIKVMRLNRKAPIISRSIGESKDMGS